MGGSGVLSWSSRVLDRGIECGIECERGKRDSIFAGKKGCQASHISSMSIAERISGSEMEMDADMTVEPWSTLDS